MDVLPLLKKEMEAETAITRKMLERIPTNKLDWKPHEKSMTMQNLAVHIAELPSWVSMAFSTDGIDFGTMDFTPTPVSSTEDIIAIFEKSKVDGLASLSNATEDDLLPNWTMRNGEHIISVMIKYEVIRHAFAQTTHHRAQLGVYLRLLGIAIPGSYGPSADEASF
ncbi:MAG TPA: DinB family protein [Chitinophagaceae bacterium]|jgi:uncharacterized damage-inducible protein DinB|nr:DinB family protein [Chitinophagaceae bacterium]